MLIRPMDSKLRKPPSRQTTAKARAARDALEALPKKKARHLVIRSEGEKRGVAVAVPREAFELFMEVLDQLADGNAVKVVPIQAELSTQEVAELLHVSRPHVVKLLDEGRIPSRKVGVHRRVRAEDVVAYREAEAARRKAVLDELAAEAQALGLGY